MHSDNEEEEESSTKKSRKKKKRKGEPKGALSSYILFTIETRPIIAEKFPDLKGKEIMSKLGEMWKEISDEKKKVRALTILCNDFVL